MLVAVGVLILGEGLIRYLHGNPSRPPTPERSVPDGLLAPDRTAGFTLMPGAVGFDGDFTVNDLGLRDPERSAPRGAHWLLLGDDAAAGLGVGDGVHLGRLLEVGLATSEDPAPEVWNGAVPLYGLEQSLHRFRSLADGHRLSPQVVILAVNLGNDAWDATLGPGVRRVVDGRLTRGRWGPWPASTAHAERAELPRHFLAPRLPGDRLLQRRVYSYRPVAGLVGEARPRGGAVAPEGLVPFSYPQFGGVAWLYLEPAPTVVEGGWGVAGRTLQTLQNEVDAQGATLILVSIPARIEVDPQSLERALAGAAPGLLGGGRRLDIDAPSRRLTAIAESMHVPLIDLRPALREAGEVTSQADDGRWTSAGHRVAATAILEGLGARGIGPRLDGAVVRAALESRVPVMKQVERGSRPSQRWVRSSRLIRLIPPAPQGWRVLGAREGFEGSLAARVTGAPDVAVASVRAEFEGPEGQVVSLAVIDGAASPAIDVWLRSTPHVAAEVPGLAPTSARIAAVATPPAPALLEAVDVGALGRLEDELRPPAGTAPRVLRVKEPRPGPDERRGVMAPGALAPALPDPPVGWESVDRQTRWAPVGEGWSSVVSQWYRSPTGSYAVRITDQGTAGGGVDAELVAQAWSRRETTGGDDVSRWVAAGVRGACRDVEGLRSCVLPLDDRGRLMLTVRGPASGGEAAFTELAGGLQKKRLPRLR